MRAAHDGPAPDHAPPSGAEPEPAPSPAARGESPVAPERFAVLQALLAHVLASVGDEQRAVIQAAPVRERFGFDQEQLREHLNLLNLVNFGGGCYAVYAELTDDDTIDVEKELYGEEFRRPARLSPLEAKALQMALDLVGPLIAADAHTSLDAVREKIEAAFGRYDMRGSAPSRTATVDNDVLSVLSAALRDHHVVQIEYLSREGENVETRIVEPHRLRGVRGEWYCDTWDRTRAGERTFRVDRIRGAVAQGEHFERREDVGRRDQGALGGEAGSAEVWFSREVARWEVERRPEVVALADGAAIATVRYGSRRWLATELCRYLGEAVLLDPQPLRAVVAARARELAAAVREAAGIRATR